jgi:hypothetical protein
VVEKRKYPRTEIDILVSYVCLDDDGRELGEEIGRALNLSQGGLLLESNAPIECRNMLLSIVDQENQLIEIKGEIVNSLEAGQGIFQSGIQFLGGHEKIRNFVINMVKIHNFQKASNRRFYNEI